MVDVQRVKNYYEILDVVFAPTDKPADQQAKIKQAFRALSNTYHPDRFEGKSQAEKDSAEVQMKVINEAYDTLSDPTKREAYDIKIGIKVVSQEDPFDQGAFDLWAKDLISAGQVDALYSYIIDPKQPRNSRKYVAIILANHYYVTEQFDQLRAIAADPRLNFASDAALTGLIKGYVKFKQKKGFASIPFSDSNDSSTASIRWRSIGNPFQDRTFAPTALDAAAKEAVDYLFTARRSSTDAKSRDYQALFLIATSDDFPNSIRNIVVNGDPSNNDRVPGLIELYAQSSHIELLVALARTPGLDTSWRTDAGMRAVKLIADYAESASVREPTYYTNLFGLTYCDVDSSGTRDEKRVVPLEVASAAVSKALDIAKTRLIRTGATVHLDYLSAWASDKLLSEKSRTAIVSAMVEISSDVVYSMMIRETCAVSLSKISLNAQDAQTLTELVTSDGVPKSAKSRIIGDLLTLSTRTTKPAIKSIALYGAIGGFGIVGDTNALYNLAGNVRVDIEYRKKAFGVLVSLYKGPSDIHSIDALLTDRRFTSLVADVLPDVLTYYQATNHYDGIMTLSIRPDYPIEIRTAAAKKYVDAVYENPEISAAGIFEYALLNQFTQEAQVHAATRSLDRVDAVTKTKTATDDISAEVFVAKRIYENSDYESSLRTRARSAYSKLLLIAGDARLLAAVAQDASFQDSNRTDCGLAAIELLKQTEAGIGVLVAIVKGNNLPAAVKVAAIGAIPPDFVSDPEHLLNVLATPGINATLKSQTLVKLVKAYEVADDAPALLAMAKNAQFGDNTRKRTASSAFTILAKRKDYLELVAAVTDSELPDSGRESASATLTTLIGAETNLNLVPESLYVGGSSFRGAVLDRAKAVSIDGALDTSSKDQAGKVAVEILRSTFDVPALVEFAKGGVSVSTSQKIAAAILEIIPEDKLGQFGLVDTSGTFRLVDIATSGDLPVDLRKTVGDCVIDRVRGKSYANQVFVTLHDSATSPDSCCLSAGLALIDSSPSNDILDNLLRTSRFPQVRSRAQIAYVDRCIVSGVATELLGLARDPVFEDSKVRILTSVVDIYAATDNFDKLYQLTNDLDVPLEVRSRAAANCAPIISIAITESDVDMLVGICANDSFDLDSRTKAGSAAVSLVLDSGNASVLTRISSSTKLVLSINDQFDQVTSLFNLIGAAQVSGDPSELFVFAQADKNSSLVKIRAVDVACEICIKNGQVDLLLDALDSSSSLDQYYSKIIDAIGKSQENIGVRCKALTSQNKTSVLIEMALDDRLEMDFRRFASEAAFCNLAKEGNVAEILGVLRSNSCPDPVREAAISPLLDAIDNSLATTALNSGNASGMLELLKIEDLPTSVRLEVGSRVVSHYEKEKSKTHLSDLLDEPSSKVPESVKIFARKALVTLDVSELSVKRPTLPKGTLPKDLFDGVVITPRKKL